MLTLDSRWQWATLQSGMQNEFIVIRIIYRAALDSITLQTRIKMALQDTVRLIAGVHTSQSDINSHLTILYPNPGDRNKDKILHVRATLGDVYWEYAGKDGITDALVTDRDRELKGPKHFTWGQVESYGKLGT